MNIEDKQVSTANTEFSTTKLVLMYREQPTESYYDHKHMFVDLNNASGGYPVRVDMLSAYNFKTIADAVKYDSKGEFIIASLEIKGTVTIDKDQDEIRKKNNKELIEKEKRRQQYEILRKEFESFK